MKYHNFDLEITDTGNGSFLLTGKSHAGEIATAELSDKTLQQVRKQVPYSASKGDPDKDFGEQLFDLLLRDGIGDLFEENYPKANGGLLRLRLCVKSLVMSAVAWEFLYHPERKVFLAAQPQTSLIRYTAQENLVNNFKIDLPLKVLLVIPEGTKLDRASILKPLFNSDLKLVEFSLQEEKCTQRAILRKLSGNYHVLHFIGTGGCDSSGYYLYLDGDENGASELVRLEPLLQLIQKSSSLKLVMLDCYSADSAIKSTLASLGPPLIESGVPAVVASQFPMTRQASLCFALEFYKQLSEGDEPGRIDAAVTLARKNVLDNDSDPANFGAPVLFSSACESVIFYFDRPKLPVLSLAWLRRLTKKIRPFARRTRARAKRLQLLRDIRSVHVRNIRVLESGDHRMGTAQLNKRVKAEQAHIIEIEDKLWPWGKTLLLALAFSLVLGLASESNLLNIFLADDFFTHAMMDWANARKKPELDKESVALVRVDASTPELQRSQLEELLPIVAKSGARVVAFDIDFVHAPKEADANLAAAINNLGSNVSVLSSAGDRIGEDGAPANPPPKPLADVLTGKYGIIEVDQPAIGKGGANHVVRRAVLASYVSDKPPDDTQDEIPVYPSLVLRTIIESAGLDESKKKVFYHLDGEYIRIGDECPHDQDPRIRATSPLDDKATFDDGKKRKYRAFGYIHHAVKGSILAAETTYSVIKDRQNDATKLNGLFDKRIVLFTLKDGKTKEDTFNVPSGEQLLGAEILANVISNLKNRAPIVRLPWFKRYLCIVLMVAIGLFLQIRFARIFRKEIALKFWLLAEPVQIPIILAVVGVIYLVIAELFYESKLIIFDITYPLIALVVSYSALGFARRYVMNEKT